MVGERQKDSSYQAHKFTWFFFRAARMSSRGGLPDNCNGKYLEITIIKNLKT